MLLHLWRHSSGIWPDPIKIFSQKLWKRYPISCAKISARSATVIRPIQKKKLMGGCINPLSRWGLTRVLLSKRPTYSQKTWHAEWSSMFPAWNSSVGNLVGCLIRVKWHRCRWSMSETHGRFPKCMLLKSFEWFVFNITVCKYFKHNSRTYASSIKLARNTPNRTVCA